MKKAIIILKFFLLFSNLCLGQKIIRQEEFNKLVDYVNCKYVLALIENNQALNSYSNYYKLNEIKSKLDKVDLYFSKSIPEYYTLEKILQKNEDALKLAKKINAFKSNYEKYNNDDSLLKSLIINKWSNIDLSKTSSIILNELKKYYNNILERNKTILQYDDMKSDLNQYSLQAAEFQGKLEQLQIQLNEVNKKVERNNEFINQLKIMFYAASMSILVIFIIILILMMTIRERVIKYVLSSKRIEDKFKIKNNSNIINLEKQINYKNYLEEIVNNVFKYLKNDKNYIRLLSIEILEFISNNDNNIKKNYDVQKSPSNESVGLTYKYLKGKNGNKFSRAENNPENSFFRLYDEKDGYALFEFCGNPAEAIANRIFSDDICLIVSGGYQNAKSVTTISPGRIKCIGDSWEVIEKIKIKLD